MQIGILEFEPVMNHAGWVTPPISSLVVQMNNSTIMVAEIDPDYKGGEDLCNKYQIDPMMGANCVIIEAVRAEACEYVAIVVPVGYRADLNGCVRRYLGVRRVSLASLVYVLKETGMEYGSITPFGLPDGWKVLVDERLMQQEVIIVGGGRRSSKLLLPTAVLVEIGAVVVSELSTKT